jgi:hypothetical protein
MRGYRYWGMLSLLGAGLALTLAGCGGGGGSSHSSSVGSDPSYSSNAKVETLAGSGSSGFADETGIKATFKSPTGLALGTLNGINYLLVADTSNNAIRKMEIASPYVVGTFVGSDTIYDSDTNAIITLNAPEGVACDSSGNVYVSDTGNSTIRTFNYNVTQKHILADSSDGLVGPAGIALSSNGSYLYVADRNNHVIRQTNISSGAVSTYAGIIDQPGTTTDTTSLLARFYNPNGVATDEGGNLYVTDYTKHTIRKIDSSGNVTTLAGLAGSYGSDDGTKTVARFKNPTGITYCSGYLYVADTGNHIIRQVNAASGAVATIAGYKEYAGYADGTGNATKFSSPTGIVSDGGSYLYVSDKGTNRIRRIDISAL